MVLGIQGRGKEMEGLKLDNSLVSFCNVGIIRQIKKFLPLSCGSGIVQGCFGFVCGVTLGVSLWIGFSTNFVISEGEKHVQLPIYGKGRPKINPAYSPSLGHSQWNKFDTLFIVLTATWSRQGSIFAVKVPCKSLRAVWIFSPESRVCPIRMNLFIACDIC